MSINQKLRDAYGVALNEVLDQIDQIATQVPRGGVQVSAITLRHQEGESQGGVTGHARVAFHVGSNVVVEGTESAMLESPPPPQAEPTAARNFRKHPDR